MELRKSKQTVSRTLRGGSIQCQMLIEMTKATTQDNPMLHFIDHRASGPQVEKSLNKMLNVEKKMIPSVITSKMN